MKIGIDIDGVLINEAAFLIDYGTKFSYENNLDYLMDTSKNGTHNIYNWPSTINDCFWRKYYLTYLTSISYIRQFSRDILSRLHKEHEIYIITARDTHNTQIPQRDVENLTREWLDRNQFQYDELVFTKNKRQYIKEHDISIMVEDNPDTIMELCKEMTVLCYYTAYNNYVIGENVVFVNSWYEIYKFIDNYTKQK